MRRMVKKYMKDNVDRRHQMAQYDGFNHILETLRRADEQVHIGIYERDDHSITRSGTSGAQNNKRRIIQQAADGGVHECVHDYSHEDMTRLQATATLAHGLGLDAHGACVPSKHIVYTKAPQVTPSTGHQLMHDLYRQLEDPALHDVFYGPDGHIKRVQHWRVDGGGNEAVKSLLNRILWTEYMEQCNIDVLMVKHCESNGNIRELVERMQACIIQAQTGHVLPYDGRLFADEATGAVDADKLKGYHLANNAEYNNRFGIRLQVKPNSLTFLLK